MDILNIIGEIEQSKIQTKQITLLTAYSGLYCFFLTDKSNLGIFGSGNQVIYVGRSINLNGRELNQHLKSGETGWSSFRRSIGAILKTSLQLAAIKRDLNPKKPRADKYKFEEAGEIRLTNWILQNTKLGYWSTNTKMSKN